MGAPNGAFFGEDDDDDAAAAAVAAWKRSEEEDPEEEDPEEEDGLSPDTAENEREDDDGDSAGRDSSPLSLASEEADTDALPPPPLPINPPQKYWAESSPKTGCSPLAPEPDPSRYCRYDRRQATMLASSICALMDFPNGAAGRRLLALAAAESRIFMDATPDSYEVLMKVLHSLPLLPPLSERL